MLAGYLRIALRTLSKNKARSFITISGLAGLNGSIIIGIYIRKETSYDTFFQGRPGIPAQHKG